MNRRRFLSLVAKGAIGAAALSQVDVEKLLWQPGAKTIFTPPADGWARSEAGVWLKKGDRFTISGRYAFDPVTRMPSVHLQVFTVTEDVTVDVSGSTAIEFVGISA